MKVVALCMILIFMSGCVSLDSVSLTPVPVNRSQKVTASAQRSIFLGFNFDNDYINTITNDLKNQCSNGTVSGLLTKTESTMYFLFFFWKKKVTATGYCVPNKIAVGTKSPKARRPSEVTEDADALEGSQEPHAL